MLIHEITPLIDETTLMIWKWMLYFYIYAKYKIDINTCKGKFKEVYSKIKEDDNPILVVYTFK